MSTATASPTPTPLRVTLVLVPAPPAVHARPGEPPSAEVALGLPGWPEGEPTWEDAEWR